MSFLLFLSILLCAPAPAPPESSCSSDDARAKMTDALYRDDDFRGYVCEGQKCSPEAFRAGVEYHQEVLRAKPEVLGCFVEPVHQATSSVTGVFVLKGAEPSLQFVFVGIGVAPTPDQRVVNGYKVLVGSERTDPGIWTDSYYVWNGKAYVLRNTKTRGQRRAEVTRTSR